MTRAVVEECRFSLSEPATGTMKLRHFHPTLPRVLLPSVCLISLPVAPHVCCGTLFIVIGEIQIKVNPIPDRLPDLCPAGLIGLVLASLPSLLPPSPPIGRMVATATVGLGLKSPRMQFSLGTALVTEPMSVRDLLQADTVGVPQLLTPVAVHQHIFIVILFTYLACLGFEILVRQFEEHRRVKIGNLRFVFDRIGRDDFAYLVFVSICAWMPRVEELVTYLRPCR